MDQEFELKLIECLDAIERGEPLDSILSRYPADAAQLRPLLQTAAALPALRFEPARAAQISARRRFLNQAAVLREQNQARRWRLPLRLIAPLAALALVIVLFGQVVAASAAALPGDTLYPVKRTVEDVRLAITSDRAGLARQFEQERRNEVAALLNDGRTAEVEFAGPIEAIEDDGLTIAGLYVSLEPGTRIDGVVAAGRRAHVHGRVAGGRLFAMSITVEPGDSPPPSLPTSTAAIPTATNTSTPRPSAIPTRTPRPATPPTAVPGITSIPEPVLVPPATPRPPQPAPSPQPAPPTAVPTQDAPQNDANGNDDNGGNDNQNDNGNDDNGGNDNQNDNSNDDQGGNDNQNDNGNDDNGGNDNGNDDNGNDNGDDNGGNDNGNGDDDRGGNDNGNDNGDDNSGNDNQNDNGDDDRGGNDNGEDDNSGSGSGGDDNSGSGNGGDDDSGGNDEGGGDEGDDNSGSGGGGDGGGRGGGDD